MGKSTKAKHGTDSEAIRIAEKVRFWREQDRINQALIPRVIRQGELLAKHITEHDDLPQLFSKAVSGALAEQERKFKEELAKAVAELGDARASLESAHSRTAALERSLAEQAQRFQSIDELLDRHEKKVRNRMMAFAGVACVIIALILIALD